MDAVDKPKRTRRPKAAPVKAPVPGHRRLAVWSALHQGASVGAMMVRLDSLRDGFLGKPVTA